MLHELFQQLASHIRSHELRTSRATPQVVLRVEEKNSRRGTSVCTERIDKAFLERTHRSENAQDQDKAMLI
ncbi:hypothetical protein A3C09_00955 [Candidatus Uhrbacteria bacterium RIFCSPHIGHO2_02_FULL_47_44]|nr:MAG: hypothetical protein A2839_05425 [Candidatus Uhrbacteria bacterium RIFCSPHIGHO2_01_FULL_47_10]OGL70287.1 MAG: hypothetical protein A3C09_00955 [Candidatus Uhrbacteria bacterium RIFCSPHIGHO2_02_FULL_47_44]